MTVSASCRLVSHDLYLLCLPQLSNCGGGALVEDLVLVCITYTDMHLLLVSAEFESQIKCWNDTLHP